LQQPEHPNQPGQPTRLMPVMIRSRMFFELASELVVAPDWDYRQARIALRPQGGETWPVTLFASDAPGAIEEVARGDVLLAIVNPSEPLTLAYRGTGPFKEPLPVRAIAVIPSHDQLAFGVTERTGLTSLDDLRERRYPLRVSLRGQRDHSVHFIVEQVLAEVGVSLADIEAWGGQVRYDPELPAGPNRIGAVERGEIDAIFDEAVGMWVGPGLELGMRFLPLPELLLERLERMGFRRSTISRTRFPALPADVPALDFSGWPIFTRADAPDDLIRAFCAALEAGKARIPWEGEGPLPLHRMCRDTPEGPLDVPLHPAAGRFWRQQGYLS
jgi:TRAP-type uncharacterized transport system substrate-binding protein